MCALLTGVQTCALPISLQRTDSRSADHSSPGADIPPNCARKAPVAGRRPGLIMADLEERDPISGAAADTAARHRSEEHTSELQSLMRISYAVFCLKNKSKPNNSTEDLNTQYHTQRKN